MNSDPVSPRKIRAGGTLSLSDWSQMQTFEQAAFLKANRVIEIERAVAIAVAMTGEEGIADLMSAAGIDDIKIDVELEKAAEKAAQGLSR